MIRRFYRCVLQRADYAFRGVGLDVGDSPGVSLAPFPEEKIKHIRELEGRVKESNGGTYSKRDSDNLSELGS